MGNASSILENTDALSSIRLINFKDFKALHTFPRYPENANITITLNQLTEAEYNKSLIVFISHCWLRGWSGAEGWDGRPHPDDAEGNKYNLCVKGIELIQKHLAPDMEECYIWCDYGCIDQDGNPAGELKLLDKIVQVCDCIFTPIVDKKHKEWEYSNDGWSFFTGYKSEAWNGNNFSYLNRGWCRVEMFYAANIPVLDDTQERRNKMRAGLKLLREQKKRTHFLYGTKEVNPPRPPIPLPPLQNSYFEKFNPEKGCLTQETDRPLIKRLVDDLRPCMPVIKEGYIGDRVDGKMHGKGIHCFANGSVYEGEFQNDRCHGFGCLKNAAGDIYEGNWQNGQLNGKGLYLAASGVMYEGDWVDGQMVGKGTYTVANGDIYEGEMKGNNFHGHGRYRIKKTGAIYEGEYVNGKKEGKGVMTWKEGSVNHSYEGDWKNNCYHGKGKMKYQDGSSYEGDWKMSSKEGYGIEVSSEGDRYEGGFHDDRRSGKGAMKYVNGDSYEGEWKEGRYHGKGMKKFANGASYDGEWLCPELHGIFSYFHGSGVYTSEKGDVYEGQFVRNRKEGKGIMKYSNGESYEGEWKSDVREGQGKLTDANGIILFEGVWKGNKQVME